MAIKYIALQSDPDNWDNPDYEFSFDTAGNITGTKQLPSYRQALAAMGLTPERVRDSGVGGDYLQYDAATGKMSGVYSTGVPAGAIAGAGDDGKGGVVSQNPYGTLTDVGGGNMQQVMPSAEYQKLTESLHPSDPVSSFLDQYGVAMMMAAGGGLTAAYGGAAGAAGGGAAAPAAGTAAGSVLPESYWSMLAGGDAAGLPSAAAGTIGAEGAAGGAAAGAGATAFPTTAAEIAAANQAAAAAVGEGVASGTTGLATGATGATGGLSSLLDGLPNLPPGSTTLASSVLGGNGGFPTTTGEINAANTYAANQIGEGVASGTSGLGTAASAAQGAGSALSRILDGTATTSDWASVLGSAGSTALGVLGSQAQTGALKDMQDKYLALGAPSRARLEASYAPGYSVFDDAATRDAATRAADISARSYSAHGGNPFGNPTAQSGIYQSVLAGVGLPQLNTYRSQNASSGQLGLNTAGTASAGVAGSTDNLYNSLGYGLGQLTQPQNNNAGSLQALLKLATGGSLT